MLRSFKEGVDSTHFTYTSVGRSFLVVSPVSDWRPESAGRRSFRSRSLQVTSRVSKRVSSVSRGNFFKPQSTSVRCCSEVNKGESLDCCCHLRPKTHTHQLQKSPASAGLQPAADGALIHGNATDAALLRLSNSTPHAKHGRLRGLC